MTATRSIPSLLALGLAMLIGCDRMPGSGPSAADAERIEEARRNANNISLALQMFETDTGRFPTDQEGLSALMTQNATDGKHWHGPYMSSLGADPWNRPYQYKLTGSNNPKGFDVFSSGPDGVPGNADDIGNWPADKPRP
jgi:general secretion pathway protein G